MTLLYVNSGSVRAILVIILCWLAPAVVRAQKPQLVVQTGHSRDVTSVAFSPDGRFVLTGSSDETARLWETATGSELRRFEGHSIGVTSVAFSPDGRFVLTGSLDSTARLWETSTGKELRQFGEYVSPVLSVAFSPDGRLVLTGIDGGIAQLWNTATGKKLRQYEGHSGSVTAVSFSPDGRLIATGSRDATSSLWETATGKQVRQFEGHSSEVSSVVFSRDGRFVLTGSEDETARLWDIATGKEIRRFEGHPATSVMFSPNGRFVLTGGSLVTTMITLDEQEAWLWDAATGKELRRFHGHSLDALNDTTSVAFSPDGQFVLAGSEDHGAQLWDAATGNELRRFAGNSLSVTSVAFSSDGRFALMALGDISTQLWDMSRGEGVRRFEGDSGKFSPDGRLVLTSAMDEVYLWDGQTGEKKRVLNEGSGQITSGTFSPDGRYVLTGSSHTVRLWETATGKGLSSISVQGSPREKNWNPSVAFSPDGRLVLAGFEDPRRQARDFVSGPDLVKLMEENRDLRLPDGRLALPGIDEKTTYLWDAETRREVQEFDGHFGSVNSVVFSPPDGKFILGSGDDNSARLWNAATGKAVREFKGHSGWVTSVGFSPDGRLALTGSWDNTARLWTTTTGQEVKGLEGHSDVVQSVTFSPDGSFVLTGSADATSRLWDVGTGHELCRLISFADGRWAVVDSEGRFDAGDLEEIQGVRWIMSDDPLHALAPETFMRDYYEPGLLARILKREKFKAVRPLSELNRVQPKIAITAVQAEGDEPNIASVSVEVAGDGRTFRRGGKDVVMKTGVSDVRVFRDGQLVAYRDGEVKLVENKATLTFPGIRLARREGKTDVEFSAYAFNADRVKSATARRSYPIPATLNQVKGRAYVISVGVNDSEDPAYRLNYAVNDAQEIQKTICEAFRRRGIFSEVVPISLVSKPTKRNIQTVLDLLAGRTVSSEDKGVVPNAGKIAPARPEDTMLISFSSHGAGDRVGNFYLLPYDIGGADTHTKVEEIYRKSISSQELSQWLRDVDAGEMVMIIDACHSAAAVESADFKPGPMGSRGFGQLAYDKGMRILAASQADSVALESAQLGHGLLTYALLKEGLEAGQADFKPKDGTILLSEWLAYGVDRLPKLYAEKLGRRGVLLTTVTQGPPPLVQQPSLFDFTKQRRDIILTAKVEERRN